LLDLITRGRRIAPRPGDLEIHAVQRDGRYKSGDDG
jgi:hypothetical protein